MPNIVIIGSSTFVGIVLPIVFWLGSVAVRLVLWTIRWTIELVIYALWGIVMVSLMAYTFVRRRKNPFYDTLREIKNLKQTGPFFRFRRMVHR
jgi:hypothetical protein